MACSSSEFACDDAWIASAGQEAGAATMRRLRRRVGILLLTVSTVAGACGSSGEVSQPPTSIDDTTSSTAPATSSIDVVGSTTPTTSTVPTTRKATVTTRRETGVAVGAPFDVPAIVQTQGFDKVRARQAAENALEATCGPDRCGVTLVDVDPKRDPTRAHCEITFTGRTDPPARTRVKRGSVIKLLFEYESGCDPTPPEENGSTTTG